MCLHWHKGTACHCSRAVPSAFEALKLAKAHLASKKNKPAVVSCPPTVHLGGLDPWDDALMAPIAAVLAEAKGGWRGHGSNLAVAGDAVGLDVLRPDQA